MRIGIRSKIGIAIFIGILLSQFGFFNRFNYITAKIDIWSGSPRIVVVGLPKRIGVVGIGLNEQYGFREAYAGCTVRWAKRRGIRAYNAQIEKYLNRRNGKGWRDKYNAERDSLIEKGFY